MKVLVFPHHLEIGGSQTNAIDLAVAMRERHGHEVIFFATPGRGSALLAERGFELLEAPTASRSPSPRVAAALSAVVSRRNFDLVHAWDWPQCLDALFGAHLPHRTPVLGSIMSMSVSRFLPRSMPLTYGTPDLVHQARRRGAKSVSLLEPPVDLERDSPAEVDGAAFRSQHRVGADQLALVVVSRLVSWLKLDGLRRTVAAAGDLAGLPVRLLVVGEGSAYAELAEQGDAVNRRAGREVVTLVGGMLDPRPAYAAADVVLGMGGSVLRGMAFGKPAVVLGEGGFSRVFDRASAPGFLHFGLYGTGSGDVSGDRLTDQLRSLLLDARRRQELSDFSRDQVTARYALADAADAVSELYAEVVAAEHALPRLLVEVSRTLAWRSASRVKQGLGIGR